MNGFVEDRSVLTRSASPPDAIVRYGELDEHIADVRYAKHANAHSPLVILIHGGFWRPQYDRAHAGAMCDALASAGWTVASIEYRRIPGDPNSTLHDVSLALARVPEQVHAAHSGVVAIGHSAGGHLALWAAATNASAQLRGVLALGAVADLESAYRQRIGEGAVEAFVGTASLVRRDIDPTLLGSPTVHVTLVHGAQDAIVPPTLAENYVARHPGARLVMVQECGHFAVIDPASQAWPVVLDELRRLS